MELLDNQILCLKDHVVIAVFEDGGVAFNLDTRASYLLNRTGAMVLDLLDGQRDFGELIGTIAQIFQQPVGRIEEDITNFLAVALFVILA